MTSYVDVLVSKLRCECVSRLYEKQKGTVDIKSWMNYCIFDITGDLMFGKSLNCLKGSKLHPWVRLIFDLIKWMSLLNVLNQFPLLYSVLMKLIGKSIAESATDHFYISAEMADERLAMGSSRPDFISAMLKNGLSEEECKNQENKQVISRAEIHSNAFMYCTFLVFF